MRRDAGDNARASYAQPAQRAPPARSVAPSGYELSPNLMGQVYFKVLDVGHPG